LEVWINNHWLFIVLNCLTIGDCDFENGLCTWTQVHAGDNFDWNLGRGRTSSTLTGPNVDHTKGTSSGNSVLI
jgi:hypothetical protein